jgi:hypothetical protein
VSGILSWPRKRKITAARLNDLKAKEAWIELAVSWTLMASEISAENNSGRKHNSSADTKSQRARADCHNSAQLQYV